MSASNRLAAAEKLTEAAPSSISQALAAFSCSATFNSIPPAVRDFAKLLIMDAVGIAVASNRFPVARSALDGIALFGHGDAIVIGSDVKLLLRDAALINGILIHALDFDDTHLQGVIHVSASCLPAALAVAAACERSVEEMLTAFILGVETSARIAAVAKGELGQVGFHPSGVVAVFGATVAAAKLFGLDERQVTMAQGIALSMAAGTTEFHTEGSWTKRLHPGWAASSGINAAALASAGFTGPLLAYEGQRGGLFKTHLGLHGKSWNAMDAIAGLGRDWETLNVALKPSPACQLSIACIDAAAALARHRRIDVQRIEKIVARIPPHAVKVVCEPAHEKHQPHSAYAAQFSLQFVVACALTHGRLGLAELDLFADPAIRALAKRVEYEVDYDTAYPKYFSGEVTVHYFGGETLHHREAINRGATDRPLTIDDIAGKFRGNARIAVSEAECERLLRAVMDIESFPSARQFAEALAVAP